MYAIIATGGKQYKVSEGDFICVEKIAGEPGDTVVFELRDVRGRALVPGPELRGQLAGRRGRGGGGSLSRGGTRKREPQPWKLS